MMGGQDPRLGFAKLFFQAQNSLSDVGVLNSDVLGRDGKDLDPKVDVTFNIRYSTIVCAVFHACPPAVVSAYDVKQHSRTSFVHHAVSRRAHCTCAWTLAHAAVTSLTPIFHSF
jgi:hypothetical protein